MVSKHVGKTCNIYTSLLLFVFSPLDGTGHASQYLHANLPVVLVHRLCNLFMGSVSWYEATAHKAKIHKFERGGGTDGGKLRVATQIMAMSR